MPYFGVRPTKRVGFLDETRGLCVLLMILYHGAFDLVVLFGVNIPAFHWPIVDWAQRFVAGIFILIAGICCRYSRNNLKRGVIALAVGLAMTLFTAFFMPGQVIYFGILHFLGCSMVLYGLLEDLLNKLPAFWGLLFMLILLAVTWQVPYQHTLGIFGLRFQLPDFLYGTRILFPLGLPGPGFHSSDYFPLIPWVFAFFAGAYLGEFFTQGIMPNTFYRTHSTFLAWVGQHALVVYVLHQPITFGILWVFFKILSVVGLWSM